VAKAIQDTVGGDLHYLDLQIGAAAEGAFIHTVVKHGDYYLDSEGAHTAEALLSRWNHEGVHGCYLSLLPLDFVPDHIPTDQATVDSLAAALKTQEQPQSPPVAPNRYPVYLSPVNGELQQHATWPECQTATSGVSGSKYKKVKDETERTQTLAKWGVALEVPAPERYLIYADQECCPQSGSTDVQTQACLLTQKAIKEAQKRGEANIEIIVATASGGDLEYIRPLLVAAQTGVKKESLSTDITGETAVQAEVYESPDAPLDLIDLKGNPNNRLILISNGQGAGTKQLVEQAQALGVKVIGYNPETRGYIGAAQPQPVSTARKAAKSQGDGR